jgi:hypothetical protein
MHQSACSLHSHGTRHCPSLQHSNRVKEMRCTLLYAKRHDRGSDDVHTCSLPFGIHAGTTEALPSRLHCCCSSVEVASSMGCQGFVSCVTNPMSTQLKAPPALASLLLSLLRRPPSSLPIHLYWMPCSAASCCSRASLLNCAHDRAREDRTVAHGLSTGRQHTTVTFLPPIH